MRFLPLRGECGHPFDHTELLMRREVPPVPPALLPPREGVADVAEVTALPRAELLPVPRTEPSDGWGWRGGGE